MVSGQKPSSLDYNKIIIIFILFFPFLNEFFIFWRSYVMYYFCDFLINNHYIFMHCLHYIVDMIINVTIVLK